MESKKNEISEYLSSKMYGFLEPMLVEVLKAQPSNSVEFCIKWLQKFQQERKKEDVSDDDDDIVDDALIERKKETMRQSKKKSRMGISEEVFGCFNKKSKFAPQIIEKSEESRMLILSLIRNSILFQNINSADEEQLIDTMGEKDCAEGELIIEEDNDGNELYIVESGEYDCFKLIDGKETYIKTYTYGESFGQLALMYNAPRAASIRTKKAGKLFTLDRLTYSNLIKDAQIRKRQLFQNTISKVQLFSELSNYEKEQFCDILKEERVESGQYAIRQGEKGNKFYIVIEGKLVAEKENNQGEKQVVYQYREGDYFGELALIHDQDRQASVKALTPTRLVSINRDTFMRILGSLKEILQRNEVRYQKYQTEMVC